MPWWILENTLIAAVLALLVVLACRVRRLAPVIRHALWLVVLIRLITPPVIAVSLFPASWRDAFAGLEKLRAVVDTTGVDDRPLSLNRNVEPGAVPPVSRGNGIEISSDATAELSEFLPLTTVESEPDSEWIVPALARSGDPPLDDRGPEVEHLQTIPSPSPVVRTGTTVAELLSAVPFWGGISGTLLAVLIQFVRIARLFGLLKRSRPAPAELAAVVQDLAGRVGVRAPRVLLSADIPSPLVCALGRAVLLWPEARSDGLPETGRQAIIVHELAHLARRDHWIGWLELFASWLWWWNPLFWYVRQQLRANSELACDAWVMGLLPEGRRDYARALVDLAECDSQKRLLAPALGIGDGSRTLFERRLVMIMGEGVRYRLGAGGLMGMVLLTLLGLPGCTAGVASDESVPTGTAIVATEPPGPSTIALDQSDSELPILPIRVPQAANEADPVSRAGSAAPLTPSSLAEPALDSGFDPMVPAVELPSESKRLPADAASPEDRLKRLEDRFEAILTELRELKNPGMNKFPHPATNSDPKSPKLTTKQKLYNTVQGKPDADTAPGALPNASDWPIPRLESTKKRPSVEGATEAVNLMRSTYKLPPGRAQAIAAFLTQNLNDEIEVRVKGDSLQVTATAEDQTAFAQFIRLVTTRGAIEPKPSAQQNGPPLDGFDDPSPPKSF